MTPARQPEAPAPYIEGRQAAPATRCLSDRFLSVYLFERQTSLRGPAPFLLRTEGSSLPRSYERSAAREAQSRQAFPALPRPSPSLPAQEGRSGRGGSWAACAEQLNGAVISPVPPTRDGSDVHNLWGSGSAQPGWAPACSQLDRCESMEEPPEGALPGAASQAWLLSARG